MYIRLLLDLSVFLMMMSLCRFVMVMCVYAHGSPFASMDLDINQFRVSTINGDEAS